jgi:hypothetical protein
MSHLNTVIRRMHLRLVVVMVLIYDFKHRL